MIEVPHKKMGELFTSMLDVDIDDHKLNKNHLKYDDALYNHSYDQILRSYSYLYLNIEEFEFHRNRFTCREQYIQEPLLKYASNLKKIFNKCNYGMHEEIKLCQQFLNGTRDDDIRIYLKKNPVLSFNDYVINAIAFAKANSITYYLNLAFPMINTYNPEKEGMFHTWLNRLEYVADMIEVPDNRMIEFFNNMVDNDVHYRVMQQTFSSVIFSVLPYEEIINYYILFFSSDCESDLHKNRFQYRYQYEEESIKKYADNLRKLYKNCGYKDNCSDKILCEQFICGIIGDDIRYHLSETLHLSFDKIVKKAITFLKDNQTTYYLNQTLSMMNIFKLDKEDSFSTWLTKFEFVANMIAVPYEIMGELFIKMLHDDVHKFINNNCETVNCLEFSYEQILDKYRYLAFGIDKLKFYRNRFINRKQFALESIENYAESLKKIYSKCFYISYFDNKISKQFINGLRDEELKNSFCTFPCMLFAETVAKVIQFKKTDIVSNYVKPAFTMINMFHPEEEERFYDWFNKFEYVTDIVGVPDDKLIEFFDEMIDNDVHKSVKKRFSSVNFFELSYEQLTNHYLRYYAFSYESNIHEKRFMCRTQYEKETIQKYVYNLRKILNKCNFTDNPIEKLIERFIDGIRDDDIRSYLNKSSFTSFTEIVAKAIEFEKSNDITHYINSAHSMINIYNPMKEGKFYEWLNKFEFVADFIKVPNNVMVKFFKKMVEYDIHTGVKQTFPCVIHFTLSYEAIINLYLRYFSFSCEFHFYKLRFLCRKQYETETIDKYAKCLYDLYDMYIDKRRMEEELCKQFLFGIRNDDIRTHLKQTPHLSFYETVEKAIAFEQGNEISNSLNEALTKLDIYDPTKDTIFSE
ncbi:hypothetical protein M0804_013400 [Polistes exclamans]|nr:hypothetical protein M0804_013400 [Polistes exclamans]